MEFKRTVTVTMSAAELRELIDIIRRLIDEDEHEYGFVSAARERYLELTKELNSAEARNK